MCTLLAVLAILHIMQDVKERTAFLELLDSYVGNIPALEKILSGSEKQPRFKRLTVTKQFCRITMLSTASGCFAFQTHCSHSETSKTLDSSVVSFSEIS
jgi:hypothetical protein